MWKLTAFIILMPGLAQAACPAVSTPILSCTLSGGNKTLDVCLNGETLTYAYGKTGKAPDLDLSSHITDAGYLPWNGIGRSIYEEVSFRNLDVTYTVWGAVDRLIKGAPESGGVVVLKNDEQLASLQCDEGTATVGFFGLGDLMDRIGQCWDFEARAWAACSE